MLLELESLHFAWPGRPMIKDCALQLGPGLCWLRGPNGVGKTTLLRLLGGSLPPTRGRIRLAGLDSATDALGYRAATYWCNEDALLMDWLSVREFVELNLSLYRADKSARARFAVLVDAFSLGDRLGAPLGALSLGEGKKILLALGLALDVKLLLLDEPLNGLDAESVTILRREISAPQRRAQQIILMTSHVAPEIAVDKVIGIESKGLSVRLQTM